LSQIELPPISTLQSTPEVTPEKVTPEKLKAKRAELLKKAKKAVLQRDASYFLDLEAKEVFFCYYFKNLVHKKKN
jgi:hypothetical protein